MIHSDRDLGNNVSCRKDTPRVASKMTTAVMRRGLGVLGVAIRAEKAIFSAAVLSSALYGVMTVASAWALGWATENVVLPAFRNGQITTGTLTLGALLIMGASLFKALGVAGRRYFAGVMQYRMQARSRRDVTRQYLRLPWPGTTGTRPGSCCPTPGPTWRPPGRRSPRCRWPSAWS